MASTVANILTGGALTGISKIVDSIRGKSPEDAAKLAQIQADLETMHTKYASDFAIAQINENVALNTIAGQNIQAEQRNWYTASARPSVIYAWIAIVIYNYILTGFLHRPPIQMPDMFWEVSGIVITGYVFARTGQDVLSRVVGGSGGSVQLPFTKLDSKGD